MRLGKLRFESKYLAIKYFYEEKQWSINWMCKQLGISHAAYYKWLHRPVPEQESENIKLAELIKEQKVMGVSLIGPADAAIAKVNDIYKKVMYLRADNYDRLVEVKDFVEAQVKDNAAYKNIIIQFDFDPMNGF